MLTWGYYAANKKQQNKTKPKKSQTPKYKLNSDILIIIIAACFQIHVSNNIMYITFYYELNIIILK